MNFGLLSRPVKEAIAKGLSYSETVSVGKVSLARTGTGAYYVDGKAVTHIPHDLHQFMPAAQRKVPPQRSCPTNLFNRSKPFKLVRAELKARPRGS